MKTVVVAARATDNAMYRAIRARHRALGSLALVWTMQASHAQTFLGTRKFLALVALLGAFVLSACSAPAPQSEARDIARLAAAIRALGDDVDPAEADRAAYLAFTYSSQLAREYQITDPPLIHNTKVNLGLRPRGLCWHWAEDMEKRLAQEQFQTLDLHRAIANSRNPLRIEHSTTIVSRRGDDMFSGIVLDPWRKGGKLTWVATRADDDYKWLPRRQVLLAKQNRKARQAQ